MQHQTVGRLIDNECAGICKEMVTVTFEVLYHHLYGGTEEDHKTPSQDSQSPGQDLNFRHPKNKAATLSTLSWHLLMLVIGKKTFLLDRIMQKSESSLEETANLEYDVNGNSCNVTD